MRALVGAESLEALMRGVNTLSEVDSRRALLAALIALRYQLGDRRL